MSATHPTDIVAAAALAVRLATAGVRVQGIRMGRIPTITVRPSSRLAALGLDGHRYAWGRDHRGPYQRMQSDVAGVRVLWMVRP